VALRGCDVLPVDIYKNSFTSLKSLYFSSWRVQRSQVSPDRRSKVPSIRKISSSSEAGSKAQGKMSYLFVRWVGRVAGSKVAPPRGKDNHCVLSFFGYFLSFWIKSMPLLRVYLFVIT